MTLIEAERAKRRGGDTALRDWVRALEATAPIAADPGRILPAVIAELAQSHGGAPALLSPRESFSYSELSGRANRYARWALGQGMAKGDVVCLMMPNRPEYMAIWLGLTSVGVVVALINTQLRGSSLTHSIDLVAPKQIIIEAQLYEELGAAGVQFASKPKIWIHGEAMGCEVPRVDLAVVQLSDASPEPSQHAGVTIADRALLIYTSGTTGLPKAAHVSHRRVLQWSFWFAGLMNTTSADRMYDCLPMYHSVGGVVATGAVLVRGGSVVLRERFSANQFWNDIVEWDCTLFQYIGELCRYLLNAPKHPRERERSHRLRIACGNGLRADVWEKFRTRFRIPRILEFYAATEGNVSLYNVEGKVGAVGRIPPFLRHRFPLALVKFDAASAEPARDGNGLCFRCEADEIGEAIGRIANGLQSGGEFEGYTNAQDSQRKIVRNVFQQGDAWFRTGDLMRMDVAGFYYFIDRIGDTFRWKGENVGTLEVAAAITAFAAISEASVYGVRVPGTEGAAGMAAIVCEGQIDLARLRRHLARRLPAYARPLFLRVMPQIAVTATFKHSKNELMREGYDPSATSDPIYFNDPGRREFVRLDDALYARIQAGRVRL